MTVTRGYVDVDGVQLHYRTTGSADGVPLVLLHQVPSSSAMWEAVMEPLANRGYRVVAFDLPGYGMSDALTPEPSVSELSDYGDVFAKAITELGLGPTFLVGHHTGSSVSLTLSAFHPEVVRAAAVWGVPALTPELAKELAEEPPPVYGPDFIDDVSSWWASRIKWTAPEFVAAVMPRSLIEMVQTGLHRPDGHNAVGRAGDHAAILSALARPVLAMTGGREMLDPDTKRAVVDYPEHLVLGDLGPKAGMDIADEDPELFADTVDAFFKAAPQVGD